MATADLTKICSKCKTEYPATTEYFSRNNGKNDGLYAWCKACHHEHNRKWREANLEQQREYREASKEKKRESSRKWRDANKDKIREQKREYYEANKDKIRAQKREYRKANRERISEREREYYTANKEKRHEYREANRERISEQKREYYREYLQTTRGKEVKRAQNQRRRARKVFAQLGLPFDESAQLKRQRCKCYYCGCKLDKYHVDHVIPLSRGGSDGAENKVLACPDCNLSKGSKLPSEWAKGGRLL